MLPTFIGQRSGSTMERPAECLGSTQHRVNDMLLVQELKCVYSKVIRALDNVSIEVGTSEIVGLLGPNGAGKTTTLRCITGEIGFLNGTILGGSICFNDMKLGSVYPFDVTQHGISLVPEDRKLFIDMTVEENLIMGSYTIRDKKMVRLRYRRVLDYFPILGDFRDRLAGYLSGGEQQMLAIGRALMSDPQLLLLDEPSTGLAPLSAAAIFEIIAKIRDEEGVSILLVEQNAVRALKIADSCYILENGRTVLHGTSSELRENQKVKDIYLGISSNTPLGSVTGE